jgi:cell division protein FtsN
MGLPSWAWVLFGLLFGVALSSLIFWKILKQRPPMPVMVEESEVSSTKTQKKTDRTQAKKSKSKKTAEQNAKVTTQNLVKSATPPEARFDFYTLLPAMSVDPLAQDTSSSKKAILPYILQAGSFKTSQQAEQLRASLALQGFQAHIQTVNVNAAESWYRVYIGPFDTKADALEAQQSLEAGPGQGLERLNIVILKTRIS